jgi:Tol biopolymer transport system component/DNA-binding winged helix-turn-helix (wHTH) protein
MKTCGPVQFGPFSFDAADGELLKNGIRLKLQDQPAKILNCLIERAGEIVSREELEKLLWPDGTFVDFDGGLNAAVNRLRRVLSDSADSPRYIETVARKGYRFIGTIESPAPPAIPAISQSAPAPLPIRRFPYARAAFLAALLVASLSATGAFFWPKRTEHGKPPKRVIQVTSEPGAETHPSFSPDGTQIVFAADFAEPGNSDIYIKNVETGNVLRLTSDAARDSYPVWSPDGRAIAFIRNEGYGGAVHIVPATGGPEAELVNVNLGRLAWTPDSRYLSALHRASQVDPPHQLLIEVGTRRTRPLLKSRDTEDYHAAFSSDGRRVALARCKGMHCEIHVGMLAPDRTAIEPTQKLATARGQVHGLAWTGDSSTILFSAGLYNDWGLWQISMHSHQTPELLNTGHQSVHYPTISLRGPGSLNRVGFETWTIDDNMWIAALPSASSPTVGPPRRLASTSRGDWAPSLSPDGGRLAFVSDRSGWQQLWIAADDGTGARQLTDLPLGAVVFPRWSPDGTEIVFSFYSDSDAGGDRAVFTIRPAQGSQPVRITPHGQRAKDGAFSSDGKWIYYAVRDSGRSQLWRSPRSGGPGEQVTKFGGERPLVSHDRVYYVSTGDGVWSTDLHGKNERKVLPEAQGAAWHTVRDGIIFVPRPNSPLAGKLAHWDVTTGEIRSLGPLPHPDLAVFTVNSQETAILYSREDQKTVDIAIIENYQQASHSTRNK